MSDIPRPPNPTRPPDPTPDTPSEPFDSLDEIDALFAAWDAGEFDADIDRPAPGEARQLARLALGLANSSDVALLDPPRDLRDRVLDLVRAEAALVDDVDIAPAVPTDLDRYRAARDEQLGADGAPRTSRDQAVARRRRTERPWWARPQLIAAAAAVLLVAGIVGLRPGRTSGDVVFAAELVASTDIPESQATGEATVVRKDGELIMRLKARGLEPTRPGEVYQCWFVGPNDSEESQDRFSVGTFSTDDGTIDVEWATAVDLERYPRVGITLEPDDGDPLRNGPKALVTKPKES